jgi:hypothetical protein
VAKRLRRIATHILNHRWQEFDGAFNDAVEPDSKYRWAPLFRPQVFDAAIAWKHLILFHQLMDVAPMPFMLLAKLLREHELRRQELLALGRLSDVDRFQPAKRVFAPWQRFVGSYEGTQTTRYGGCLRCQVLASGYRSRPGE